MRVLLVYCHPCGDSFVSAMRDAALAGLAEARHEVRVVDLYAEGFRPEMTAEERRRYHDEGANTEGVEAHVDLVRWAEAMVFVYPTWWYGLPAMLKGWFDRVFVPHVVFLMPTETQGIRGNLGNVRRLVVVTSCGATWLVSKIVGEPGRKTILRGLRTICHPRCRTRYLALYKMDTVSADRRAAYLERVRRTLAGLA
jgi:putative NADPH-quinone reductase